MPGAALVKCCATENETKENRVPRAVRFKYYGGIDVLRVEEVDWPVPGPGQVLVRVKPPGTTQARRPSARGL